MFSSHEQLTTDTPTMVRGMDVDTMQQQGAAGVQLAQASQHDQAQQGAEAEDHEIIDATRALFGIDSNGNCNGNGSQ